MLARNQIRQHFLDITCLTYKNLAAAALKRTGTAEEAREFGSFREKGKPTIDELKRIGMYYEPKGICLSA